MKRTIASFIALLFLIAPAAFGQSGGDFTITQSVIAGGGERSAGGTFTLTGSIGQPLAGITSRGGNQFAVAGGFFTADPTPPIATTAQIAGRVTASNGTPLSGIQVTLTGGAHTAIPLVIFTDADGNYSFPALATGESYVVMLTSKRFVFMPSNQIVDLTADVTALNFTSAVSRRRDARNRR